MGQRPDGRVRPVGKRPHTQRPSGSEDAGTWLPAPVCSSHGDPAASHSAKAAAKACFRNDPRGDLQPGEACHSPVMFFVHQVVPGPERHQVSVVCRGRDGHGACAAHVGMTQLVGEDLQLIGGETIVVPKHVIVGRPACSLKADRRVRETSRAPMQHGAAETGCAEPDASQGTRWENS